MGKSRLQLIIGGVIIASTINMPTTRPTASTFSDNGINTIDKMIRETNDNRIKQEEQNKINMLNEIGKGLVEINKKKQEEGGVRDKKGKLLTNHNYPIVALPKDIPYGSRIEFDSEVLGSTEFLSVDSGNAIKWIDENECVVDVFVPYASQSYLNKLGRHKMYGYIYDLGY